jgi:voltage-gated potassium channel
MPEPPGDVPRWRRRLHEVIFEADTPAGKAFDVGLILAILLSVLAVMLESVDTVRDRAPGVFRAAEWTVTILFTAEYLLRLLAVRRPLAYATSFYGVVDLLAVLPSYIGWLVPGAGVLRTVRILRVLRIFRVLKLAQYIAEAEQLVRALRASRRKIAVFLFGVASLVVILGALMHVVEGPEHGFSSIPVSVYWAVVTLTTVGYGDISPGTPAGQFLAACIMILGYSIIAVPTGIVTAEMVRSPAEAPGTQACPACGRGGHDTDAVHCKHCGARL